MIEVSHLTKRYGSRAAVDNLSFQAEKGKIYGFLGPNGAGKSTTMNMMTGYLAATSGTVVIDSFDIMKQPEEAKSRIGYLPEVPPVYPDMTVTEYLNFVAQLKKIPKKERAEAISRAMEKTEIQSVSHRLIRNLSKGYKQRVGLAQAILNNPDIIILDEPTSGLDPEQQKEMFDYIRSLREDHTIILSSHILSDVSAVCDYIWIINHGKLVASDTPEALTARMTTSQEIVLTVLGDRQTLEKALEPEKRIREVTFSESAGEDGQTSVTATIISDSSEDLRPAVSRAAFAAGLTVLSMTRREKSLEDIFLTLTGNLPAEKPRKKKKGFGIRLKKGEQNQPVEVTVEVESDTENESGKTDSFGSQDS